MREFDLINKLIKPLAGKNSAQLGDDCAFFDGYCISKDVLIAGVHFFAKDDPYDLARKALRVNLSDLAASGATPFGFMLGLALPKKTDQKWLKRFFAGLAKDIKHFKVQLLGGDTTYHNGELVISITVIGKAKKPIQRNGAKVGDNIFVSGKIGGGYLGLQAKKQGNKSKKYELPEPRIDLVSLIQSRTTSCIDISDGLLADLGHICEESGVGAEIDSDLIPLFDPRADLLKQLTGGDDYELLFTSKAKTLPNCHKIGIITRHIGIILDGKKVKPEGYVHEG